MACLLLLSVKVPVVRGRVTFYQPKNQVRKKFSRFFCLFCFVRDKLQFVSFFRSFCLWPECIFTLLMCNPNLLTLVTGTQSKGSYRTGEHGVTVQLQNISRMFLVSEVCNNLCIKTTEKHPRWTLALSRFLSVISQIECYFSFFQ